MTEIKLGDHVKVKLAPKGFWSTGLVIGITRYLTGDHAYVVSFPCMNGHGVDRHTLSPFEIELDQPKERPEVDGAKPDWTGSGVGE